MKVRIQFEEGDECALRLVEFEVTADLPQAFRVMSQAYGYAHGRVLAKAVVEEMSESAWLDPGVMEDIVTEAVRRWPGEREDLANLLKRCIAIAKGDA